MNQSSELKGNAVYISDGIMSGSSIPSWCNGFIKEHRDSSIRAVLCHDIEFLYILTVRISIRTLVLVLSNFKRTLVPCKNLSPSPGENFQKIEVKFCGRRFSDFQPVFSLGGGIKIIYLDFEIRKNFQKKVGNLKIIFL